MVLTLAPSTFLIPKSSFYLHHIDFGHHWDRASLFVDRYAVVDDFPLLSGSYNLLIDFAIHRASHHFADYFFGKGIGSRKEKSCGITQVRVTTLQDG